MDENVWTIFLQIYKCVIMVKERAENSIFCA